MELTESGHRIVSAASVVIDEVRAAEQAIGVARTAAAMQFAVTTQCYTCYHWLPPVVGAFHQEHPDVAVTIVPEAIDAPFRYLQEGRVDVAIVFTTPAPEGVATVELFRDEMVALVSPSHRAARWKRFEPEAFAEETLIVHSDPRTSALVSQVLSPAGLQPKATMEVRLTEAVLSFVASSLGVAVLARWAAAPAIQSGAVVAIPIGKAGLYRSWHAAFMERRRGSPIVQSFVGHVKRRAFGGATTSVKRARRP